MIDCGVPISKIRKKLYKIRTLIVTHNHSDHINSKTYQTIRKQFPRIKTIGNYEVHQIHGVDIIANAGIEIKRGEIVYLPFEAPHDVLNYGYVWSVGGERIIYATDLWTMENAPEGPFDWFFIESNHDEKKIEQVMDKRAYGYDSWRAAKRHLSTQAAKGFYYTNRRNKDSKFIELHKSSKFY